MAINLRTFQFTFINIYKSSTEINLVYKQLSKTQIDTLLFLQLQTSVEPKIKRQESLKREEQKRLYRQKPGPQIAKSSPIINTVVPSTTSPISRSEAVKRNNLAKYQPRNYQALPPKYNEAPAPSLPSGDSPPPLAPRISNTKKLSPPPRPAPPIHNTLQG